MPDQRYRVLSLDGGGVRGLITAVWLERLEQLLDGPLTEAHLLLARQAMAEEAPLDALGHARAALARLGPAGKMTNSAGLHSSRSEYASRDRTLPTASVPPRVSCS